MSTPLIEIKNLSAGYDSRTVLRNVNLTVYDRDFLGIIGPNGGGKTTLIKCILGGFILRYVVLKFKIGTSGEPPELKHLSRARKRHQTRFRK